MGFVTFYVFFAPEYEERVCQIFDTPSFDLINFLHGCRGISTDIQFQSAVSLAFVSLICVDAMILVTMECDEFTDTEYLRLYI